MLGNENGIDVVDDSEPPALASTQSDREEEAALESDIRLNEGCSSNRSRRLQIDVGCLTTKRQPLRIGTWNVRSLYATGKLDNAIKEAKDMNIDILGLSEIRWTGSGKIQKEQHTILYSGGDNHTRGVGIIINRNINKAVLGYWPVSDRIIMMKIQGKPFNIAIVRVYAPTSASTDDEIEEFYNLLESTLDQVKSNEVLVVMGDLNANVGQERNGNIVGPCGVGEKNERGEELIEFCQSRKLTITNTWFTQPNRRKYTWISPDGKTRNQIDYIMINTRFRNSVKQTKTYPGADIGSDHNPVVATVKINLKRIKKKENMEQYNLDMLKDEHMRQQYAVEVNNIFDCLEHEVTEQ